MGGVAELISYVTLTAAPRLAAAAAKLPKEVLANFFLLAFVLIVGCVLIVLRWVFMESCPWGADHSKLVTDWVNILLDVLFAIFDSIKLIIGSIIDAVRILEGKSPNAIDLSKKPAHVSNSQVHHFLVTTPAKCHDYVDMAELLRLPIRHLMHPSVCPVLRYTWPVGWLHTLTHAFIGWMSYDDTPVVGGGNCNVTPDDLDWLCVGLGSGYLIVEVLLPALFVILCATEFIWAVVATTLEVTWRASVIAAAAASRAVTRVAAPLLQSLLLALVGKRGKGV